MTPPNEPSNKSGIPASVGKRAAMLGGQIGITTLVIILGAVFGGIWLDRFFGTKLLFTLLIVFGTVPVSLFITYRMARQAVKDYEATHHPTTSSSAASRNNQPKEGEETGE